MENSKNNYKRAGLELLESLFEETLNISVK